jgi:hypothetical protein
MSESDPPAISSSMAQLALMNFARTSYSNWKASTEFEQQVLTANHVVQALVCFSLHLT